MPGILISGFQVLQFGSFGKQSGGADNVPMYVFLELYECLLSLFYGMWSYLRTIRPTDLSQRDILILPGFGSAKEFYSRLEEALAELGYKPATLDVPGFANEAEYSRWLDQALSSVHRPILVIAHNTAGLVVGSLSDSSRRKIETLITLGTPFGGYRFLGFLSRAEWNLGAARLGLRLPAYLFINRFYPLSPIREYFFLPNGENLLYGQGRDQWFDIPGNYNLVRRAENIRTLKEFLVSIQSPQPLAYEKEPSETQDSPPRRGAIPPRSVSKRNKTPQRSSSLSKPKAKRTSRLETESPRKKAGKKTTAKKKRK